MNRALPPVEAAAMAGFSDQSHFTNFFKEFIGLTPRQYQKILPPHQNLMKNRKRSIIMNHN
ncbi:MAG: helix-turn-helix domain-containing protein [Enterocloster sp.]